MDDKEIIDMYCKSNTPFFIGIVSDIGESMN